MEELRLECVALAEGKTFNRTVIPHQYAFNLFPHNSSYNDGSPEKVNVHAPTGYCEEEWKMVGETHKIFADNNLRLNATCVRVPVLRAHSEALNIKLSKKASISEVYDVLRRAKGIQIMEEPSKNRWPMPIDASGKDPVLVGRIRVDQSQENAYDMWVVGDQIRKGAALNAIQIAELL